MKENKKKIKEKRRGIVLTWCSVYNRPIEDHQHSYASINLPHNPNEEKDSNSKKYFQRNFEINGTVIDWRLQWRPALERKKIMGKK